MAYTCEMAMLLPLPFRRGEGRGEGSVCSFALFQWQWGRGEGSVSVVYPAVPFVSLARRFASLGFSGFGFALDSPEVGHLVIKEPSVMLR